MSTNTYKICITGQVQGVGFRPYVYRLAKKFSIRGTVSNNKDGVIINVQGLKDNIDKFYETLVTFPPEISKIDDSCIYEVYNEGFEDFRIIPSDETSKLNLRLTPDFAICDTCKKEISDINNRRYNYPFTTCVNCGPRWAITKQFPFERHNTSMDVFQMCASCKDEYTIPENRRFHSQTNSCSSCGIALYLEDHTSTRIIIKDSIFKTIKDLLLNGAIIAIKNTSGYLLCCDARNTSGVKKLRQKKHRPQKPFAVMYPSMEILEEHFEITAKEKNMLTSVERPIVIIPNINNSDPVISSLVMPGLKQLGVMLPNSGILQLLANEIDFPLVATSGNVSGSPVISNEKDALDKLQSIADYFLQHNLEITHPQDDSVVKFSKRYSDPILFRRSRGFAPNYFGVIKTVDKPIMAMGAHLKSTVSFIPNHHLYISQYLGYLNNYDVYKRFVGTASDFIDIFKENPQIVLVDGHPRYQSTLYGIELAEKFNAKLYRIQHHKAHFASVLAEHNLFDTTEPVLGVIWDGTGYGDDQQIWGGEFFNYSNHKMHRIAHFDYFDWLAGDKMAKEPRLSLFSLVEDSEQNVVSQKFPTAEMNIYKALKKGNTLKTSSVGRLFDAVASLLGLCDINTYEGEAAIKLENQVDDYDLNHCRTYAEVLSDRCIPTKAIIRGIINDLENHREKSQIICNFLYTLARIILEISNQQSIKKIAFSGGVFQNTVLIDMLKDLAKDRFELFFNRSLSPNDENISLGQIMYHLHSIDA